jgi:hypothetical protein
MKKKIVAAFLPSLVLMSVGVWLGYDTPSPLPSPAAVGGSARIDAGAHLDAGPCNTDDDARACDSRFTCFTAASVNPYPADVVPPDAGLRTLPKRGSRP